MDDVEVVAKPWQVRTAGWLLVIPAVVACGPSIAVAGHDRVLAGIAVAVTLVVFYGMFAVNLNLPAAQLAGGWGSVALAVLGVVLAPVGGPLGYVVATACVPTAFLLLVPADSRAWFKR